MAGRCFASRLSVELLSEMEAEIRRRHYADFAGLVEWCCVRNIKVSKSAMGRYCYLLRQFDGIAHAGGSMRGVIDRVRPQ